MIQRLENKRTDRRLGFLFQGASETQAFDWLDRLVKALLVGSVDQADGGGGVKVIDFSEVPSDVLPLMVRQVAKLAFSVQQWTEASRESRRKVANMELGWLLLASGPLRSTALY